MDPSRAAPTLVFAAAVAVLPTIQFDPTTAVWRVRSTNHKIYYPSTLDVDAIAGEAERAYITVSGERRRQVSAKVPLILLRTDRDLPHSDQEAAVILRARRSAGSRSSVVRRRGSPESRERAGARPGAHL